MRVIFVGIHNKPGLAPLCSSTKSGKLVDRVINSLHGYTCEKTNLFDIDHLPTEDEQLGRTVVYDWCKRVEWHSDCVVVCLGQFVRDYFSKTQIEFIGAGHPSSVWSLINQAKYINNIVTKVLTWGNSATA